MPIWITLLPSLVNAIIQVIKFVIELNKTNPRAAAECSTALRIARKTGDTKAIQNLVSQLGKDATCNKK